MTNRELLMKQLEREQRYCDSQEVGTDTYDKSFNRLCDLRKELLALDKADAELEIKEKEVKGVKIDRAIKNGIDIGKTVLTGVIVPVGISLGVMAMEKEGYTLTSLCKSIVNQCISKKN